MDNREMFDEINQLIGSVATALEISEMEVVTAIEQGRLGLEMKTDEDGRNFLEATCDDKIVLIYPGAVYRPTDSADQTDASDDDDCGSGCSCGH